MTSSQNLTSISQLKEVRPASCDRHLPPWQGTSSKPIGSVLPLDSSLSLASLLFFGGLLFNYLLESWVSANLGGKVESVLFYVTVLSTRVYTLCSFFATSLKALAVGKDWAIAVY